MSTLRVITQFPERLGKWVRETERQTLEGVRVPVYRNEGTGKIARVQLLHGNWLGVLETPFLSVYEYSAMTGPSRLPSINERGDRLYTTTATVDRTGQRIRAYWAWNMAGQWFCPDLPRAEFRGATSLYKLTVVFDIGGAMEVDHEEIDLVRDFLDTIKPQLQFDPPQPQ